MKGKKVLFKSMASLSLAMMLMILSIPMGVFAEDGGHTHSIIKVDAKNASCMEEGNEEYYKCEGCEDIFSDELGTIPFEGSPAIPKLDHVWSDTYRYDDEYHWQICTNDDCTAISEKMRHSFWEGKCFCGYEEPFSQGKQPSDVFYINTKSGNDANDGTTAETAVATVPIALKYLNDGGTLYISGDISISSADLSSRYGISLVGDGSNTVTFTGSAGTFSSITGFAKVILNGVDTPSSISECSTLELNGSTVRGIVNVGTLNCVGSISTLRNEGGNVASGLSIENGLIILIPGRFGSVVGSLDMEDGIVALTCDASEDAISKVSLSIMNSGNGKFRIIYKNGSFVTEAHTHSMEYFGEKVPSCTHDGYEAYYKCSTCGKMYRDEQATKPLDKIVTIPAKGHDFVDKYSFDAKEHWYACNNGCGVKDSVGDHTLDENNVCTVCGCKIYKVLDEASENYKPGVTESISFRFDGKVEALKNVYVGGRLVPSNFYEVKSGSVIIILSKDYLKTLPVGTHTLKVEFKDGLAETKFETLLAGQGTGGTEGGNTGESGDTNDKVDDTEKESVTDNKDETVKEPVTDNKVDETEKEPVKGSDKDTVTEKESEKTTTSDKKTDAVVTGDSFMIKLVSMVMIVSTFVMALTFIYVSLKKNKK